jgi:hypothetical protein
MKLPSMLLEWSIFIERLFLILFNDGGQWSAGLGLAFFHTIDQRLIEIFSIICIYLPHSQQR